MPHRKSLRADVHRSGGWHRPRHLHPALLLVDDPYSPQQEQPQQFEIAHSARFYVRLLQGEVLLVRSCAFAGDCRLHRRDACPVGTASSTSVSRGDDQHVYAESCSLLRAIQLGTSHAHRVHRAYFAHPVQFVRVPLLHVKFRPERCGHISIRKEACRNGQGVRLLAAHCCLRHHVVLRGPGSYRCRTPSEPGHVPFPESETSG
mmetsp:Transcript_21632/g.69945  ORF Transcript_21632/g.69945 Transcript_21632/m.69945 type:complete len:204 (-) Transcript_21632:1375-1986(-)